MLILTATHPSVIILTFFTNENNNKNKTKSNTVVCTFCTMLLRTTNKPH